MAFVISYTAAPSGNNVCNSITITDITGNYSVSNPTGYGTPNPAKTDITVSSIVITPPNSTALSAIDLTVGYLYPKTNSTATFPSTLLNGGDTLTPGVWTFNLTISTSGGTGLPTTQTVTVYTLIQCASECCLKQLSNSYNEACKGCKEDRKDKWRRAKDLYDSVTYSYNCGNYEQANEQQELLDAICDDTDCGCP